MIANENAAEYHNRRNFIQKGIQIAALTGFTEMTVFGCKEQRRGREEEVDQPEDLMQEHGLLNRLLLIYDHCKMHLVGETII